LTEPWSRVLVGRFGVESPGGCDHGAASHREHADAPVHRQRVPRQPRRRPGSVDLRRAREEDHHASGLPELRPHARASLRCAARGPRARDERLDGADGMGRLHPPILPRAQDGRGAGGRARRDRGVGADHLRVAGPLARLQGGVPRHARRERRVLRALPGQRAPLVPVLAGARAVHQSRDHPPAGRPQPGPRRARRPDRHLRSRHQGNRRRHLCLGRQGRRDGLGADALHLRRPSRADPGPGQELRDRVHGADQRQGREAHLPGVERDARGPAREPVRLPAVEPPRRERRDLRDGRRVRPLGGRLRPRRRRESSTSSPGS